MWFNLQNNNQQHNQQQEMKEQQQQQQQQQQQHRKLIIEESLRPRLEALLPNNNDLAVSTGLLLAQIGSDSSLWLLGLIPTPLKDESPNEEDEDGREGEDGDEGAKVKQAKKGKNKKAKEVEELDEAWITKHALEVCDENEFKNRKPNAH